MGRTITACLKVTASENQTLLQLGGGVSSGKGLRVLLEAHQRGLGRLVVPDELAGKIGDHMADGTPIVVTEPTIPDDAVGGTVQPHRHRRGKYLRSDYEAGVEMKVYQCTGCDKEMR
jgi:hypothetical protein